MPVDVLSLLRDVNAEFMCKAFEEFVGVASDAGAGGGTTISKSTTNAESFRTLGNEQYRKGNLDQALKLYTNSIASSIEDTRESAFAYANRSAVFFAKKEYIPCLLDVNRALAGSYPEDIRGKLHDRKERCLARLRASGENMDGVLDNVTDPINVDDNEDWRQLFCKFNHPFLPNTSAKVQLECTERLGRHFKAIADIEPGECLSVEELFATDVTDVIPHDARIHTTNCSFCLKACRASIPCLSCTQALYCSKNCRTKAHDMYHRIECGLWSIMYRQRKLEVHERLAIRMLLIGTEQGAKLSYLMNTLTVQRIFAENVDPTARKPFCSDYLSTLTLCRTFDQPLRSEIDSAVEVIVALRGLSFFSNAAEKSSDGYSSEIFAAALLINHRYTHRKKGFQFLHKATEEKSTYYAQPFLHTFLNHSCNPNVSCITRNRMSALFASRPIKKNERLVISYGGFFGDVPKSARSFMLAMMYNFSCRCEACDKDWPTTAGLAEWKLNFISGTNRKLHRDLLKLATPIFDGGIQSLKNAEIIGILVNIVKLVHSRVRPPSVLHVSGEMVLGHLLLQVHTDTNLIKRTGEAEKSMLEGVENLLIDDIQRPFGDVFDMTNILEKLYINIRKRYSENRMRYTI